MSDETTYTGMRGEWSDLITPLANHPPGLEHLEAFRAKLETFLVRATEITMQQGSLTASKQELSQELRVVMTKGQRLAAVVRKALKEHYGPQAEQLAAFGIQPFRGRRRDPIEEPPPAPEIAGQVDDPDDH